MPPGPFPKKLAATAVSASVSTAVVPRCAATAMVIAATVIAAKTDAGTAAAEEKQ